MIQLLEEYIPLEYHESLMETVTNGNLVLRNVLLQAANKKNQNNRVYPNAVLMREATKYQNVIKERRALGELDHPESPIVNLRNVSHNISNLRCEGDNVFGDIEVLTTPSGNIVRELIRNKIRLGVSSRGLGSLRATNEGTNEVQDDFNLICFDIVSNPSTSGAFLNESVGHQTQTVKINQLIHSLLAELSGEQGQ